MRPLLLLAVAVAGCSGLPPDTLVPLQGGEGAAGLTLAVDLDGAPNPDVNVWVAAGLGGGVDAALGVDVPLALMIAGPRAVALPLTGAFPGIAVRKTFDNGLGIGVGSASRLLFIPGDSSGVVPHVSTLGAFVTAATPRDQTMQGRATLHLGYAEVRRPNASTTQRGLAVHLAGQGGPAIAMADTARAVLAVRAHAGAFVWPQRGRVQGPTLGLTAQMTHLTDEAGVE